MSVFTPLRNRRTVATVFALGGAMKLASHLQPLYAQQNLGVNIAQIGGVNVLTALCDNSSGIQSTVINIGTTQAQVVASTVSSNIVFVCGFNFTTADSSNLFKWVEGTSTDCITGQADKSATYNLSSKSGIAIGNAGFAQFRTTSGASLCIDATSTGVYGMLTYKIST